MAAEGESLANISASVGLMLLDVTTRLGMTPEEQKVMLGSGFIKKLSRKRGKASLDGRTQPRPQQLSFTQRYIQL